MEAILPKLQTVRPVGGSFIPGLAASLPRSTGAGPVGPQSIGDVILASLDDDKAENTVVIDLAGKTAIADTMIIASGRSARQVGAMADHLRDRLEAVGVGPVRIEGRAGADWVLIDAGDVIVHLFRPEVRAFYNIEKMWGMDAPLAGQLSA